MHFNFAGVSHGLGMCPTARLTHTSLTLVKAYVLTLLRAQAVHDPKQTPLRSRQLWRDLLAPWVAGGAVQRRRRVQPPGARGAGHPRIVHIQGFLGFWVLLQEALFIHDAVYSYKARKALSIHAWYVAKGF